MDPVLMPAEWSAHRAVWLAWPSHGDLWLENLKPAQDEFVAFCSAIDEKLEILVPDATALKAAQSRLRGLPVNFHEIPFGDIWLRDTGPLFLKDGDGKVSAKCFGFNGWGGKYQLPFDPHVSVRVARAARMDIKKEPWILEGGSIEVDGEGTCLTTEQCLLNDNRNAQWRRSDAEQALQKALGVQKVLWIQRGLLNDHTDGHIDTIARFVGPAHVVCMKPSGTDDPNWEVLKEIARDLREMTDAKGRPLKVTEVPSPGRVLDEDGKIMPASFVNFYISNTKVVVPVYGTPFDADAVAAIGQCFPNRKTVGVSARAILAGGGAFHCISQQEPV